MKMEERYRDTSRYEDIINLPHHVSAKHPQMALSDRAAQFLPFQALTGYSDAVQETARLTEEFLDLDESSRADLDRKLAVLQQHLSQQPKIQAVVFQPDERKNGGAYRTVSGMIRKIDFYERKLVMEDRISLPMDYLIEIDSELFDRMDLTE